MLAPIACTVSENAKFEPKIYLTSWRKANKTVGQDNEVWIEFQKII